MDKIFAMDKHVQKLCFDSLSRSLWFSIYSFLWVLNSVNSYKTFTATKGLPNNELWMLCEIRDIVECKVIGDKTYLCLNELNVKSKKYEFRTYVEWNNCVLLLFSHFSLLLWGNSLSIDFDFDHINRPFEAIVNYW